MPRVQPRHQPHRPAHAQSLATPTAGASAFYADVEAVDEAPARLDWSAVDAYMALHQHEDLVLERNERQGYVMRLVRKAGSGARVIGEVAIGDFPKPLADVRRLAAATELIA